MNVEEMKKYAMLEEIKPIDYYINYVWSRWCFIIESKRIANLNFDILKNSVTYGNTSQYNFEFYNCYIDGITLTNLIKDIINNENLSDIVFSFVDCYIKNIELFETIYKDCPIIINSFRGCEFNSLKDIKGIDKSICNFIDCECKDFLNYKCPDIGEFVGYKKCLIEDISEYCIVKLLIPEDARRLTAWESHKCRCDKAKVIGIYSMDGKDISGKGYTPTNTFYTDGPTTYYGLNDTVYPDDYCPIQKMCVLMVFISL